MADNDKLLQFVRDEIKKYIETDAEMIRIKVDMDNTYHMINQFTDNLISGIVNSTELLAVVKLLLTIIKLDQRYYNNSIPLIVNIVLQLVNKFPDKFKSS